MPLIEPLLFIASVLLLPLIAMGYSVVRWREHWRVAELTETEVTEHGVGAFRRGQLRAERLRPVREVQPAALRFASFLCYFAGQWVVPGVMCWVLGLLVMGDRYGATDSPTFWVLWLFGPLGVWVGVVAWRTGAALLRPDGAAAARWVKRLVRWEIGANGLLAVASLGAMAAGRRDREMLVGALVAAVLSCLLAWLVDTVFRHHQAEYPQPAAPTDVEAR